jgi:hypothetical protein
MARALRLGLFDLAHLYRGQGDVLQHGQVGKRLNCWKTMPVSMRMASMLRTSSVQRDAVHNDLPALVFFEAVDRADKGGLARAGGAR